MPVKTCQLAAFCIMLTGSGDTHELRLVHHGSENHFRTSKALVEGTTMELNPLHWSGY